MNRIVPLVLLVLGACRSQAPELPYYDGADFTPRWTLGAGGSMHTVRPFQLTDQHGRAFTERDVNGKIAVVSFFFTTCTDVCPLTVKSLLALQREFLDDDQIVLLSHSVTPHHDSASVLQTFARANRIDARRWKLLTGTKDDIYDLGRRFYFLDDDRGEVGKEAVFTHTENFVLMDGQRRLRGVYNAMDPVSMQALVRDIRILKGGSV
jgi:protein SCO1